MAMSDDAALNALGTLELFECCTRDELDDIRNVVTAVAVDAGHDVCLQGEYAREFFVVLQGDLLVSRDNKLVATLRAGEWFGEIALNLRCLRTASVTSVTPAVLLVFDSRAYQALRAICPDVGASIDAAMQDRLVMLHAQFGWSVADDRAHHPRSRLRPWTMRS